ncbi:DUF6192 family protein [Actinoplanes regularis]|uniref:RacO protein n=1 Tax=Actinoplanes regularis TaxID=52697 RepID=A0A239KEZ9_9ACTN|nr:DUF6192 family protein [Actinoplanes regularis]GIE90700.1 hypothetical protein Are01nite_71800 [Actinoplanes regularis]SNT16282.1 hypothetical protein SAMN06264365_1483 [Actinoplanes regularis]
MVATIGQVTQQRYDELVAQSRDLVREHGRIQFKLGDNALEIEPMGPHGGSQPHQMPGLGVTEALRMFAEDIGVAPDTMKGWRWVASRWPAEKRRDDVSFHIHRVLASIPDADQRFAVISEPPVLARTGERRWTEDEAKRRLGWHVTRPETVQEKVTAVHDLVTDDEVATRVAADLLRRPKVAFKASAETSVQERVGAVHELVRDDEVASQIATDLLRRPEVAARAMTDTTARHLVNRAQADQSRQGAEMVRQRTPALQHIEHTSEFLDLVGACAQFVASAGRIVPGLRGQNYTEDEKATVQRNLARVRAAADWIEGAVATGQVTPEEGLARLLAGE